jgi:hypothetical protein
MIGEFCPKVFALNTHLALGLKSWVVELGAEQSARLVTRRVYPPLPTAKVGCQTYSRVAYGIL